MMDRRAFLKAGALTAGAAALPGLAPPKYKLSVAAYSFRKYLNLKNPSMTLEEFIEWCAGQSVEGCELTEYYFKKPVTPAYVLGLKRQAIRFGLDITGTPVGNTFTLPPGPKRDGQIATMKKWIDVSAELGSPAIRIFAGGTPKGTTDAQARTWAVECIEACLGQAEKRGVILAIENHGGVVSDAAGILEFVNAIRSDWFGVNLDTGNFRTKDPYADIEQVAKHAVTCQIKVEISVGGKRQAADYARIVAILRKAGYRGYLTLEYEAREDPKIAVPKHLKALRALS